MLANNIQQEKKSQEKNPKKYTEDMKMITYGQLRAEQIQIGAVSEQVPGPRRPRQLLRATLAIGRSKRMTRNGSRR